MGRAGAVRVAAVRWEPELKALITTRNPSVRRVSAVHMTTPAPPFSPGAFRSATSTCRASKRPLRKQYPLGQ